MAKTYRQVFALFWLAVLAFGISNSEAANIGVHELLLNGTTVNLTPIPQPVLTGNGTGAAPLLPGTTTLDIIVNSQGGVYTTPDTFFTVTGNVTGTNSGGQFASLILTVTVVDNKQVSQGQDVFELDLTQSFLMTSIGPRFVAGVLKGNCNAQATAVASQVSAGVAIDFQVLTPALAGNCAPLGQFANSNFTRIQIDPLMDVNAALFFSFGQGAAGQAISLPLEIRLVPEPSTLILFASGLLTIVAFMRRSNARRVYKKMAYETIPDLAGRAASVFGSGFRVETASSDNGSSGSWECPRLRRTWKRAP